MAANKLARRIRKTPARFISVFIEMTLGVSALLTPTISGGVYAFLSKHFPSLTITSIGVIFILFALLTILITDIRFYFVIAFLFSMVAVAAMVGALVGEVTFQSGILWMGVALYNLWAFPESSGNGQ